ncbi:DUF3194 domain-containing protein [Vulcanisaeta souniana]|uniref:DUF3194 domain-containing protein n=1 Tax=Vulcanisaeta souniana JCM 11219 TaxID=1293586 RepID=A0A830DZT9_9CREN|nr:DUF3194 domain-containing protein [Vulcanisaeta souniana]BDR91999.1 hypothetical protein Vsou_10920 [Vulcanisaeta souniana JCM 11219]GGI68693.1 hypothetical protein GCM10007112_02120 [Vulcanisaeta souniana JCM 11219]
MSTSEALNEIANVVAEEVYRYLMHKLPDRLLEDVVINVGFTDPTNYTLEISIDVSANPLLSGLDSIINSAIEFGFKIADYLMDKFKRGELVGLSIGEIERVAEEYAKSLRNNA